MKKFHGWYRIADELLFVEDAWEWVRNTMGAPNETGRWFYQNGFYYFKNERDAMLYQLAWAEKRDDLLA